MSNFKKLKKYNQILLAIGGTFALLFFLSIGTDILHDIFSSNYDRTYQEGILAEEETDALLKDSLRKQIISFNNLELIDSANKIYLLPVRQADLNDEESTNDNDLLGLINTFSSNRDYYKSYRGSGGTINNLAIYDSKKNKSQIIFESRISICEYQIIHQAKETYILIIATNKDSNKDKYLNVHDLQNLFIYDLNQQQLTKVAAKEQFTTLDIVEYKTTKEVMGKLGIDRDKDGEFGFGREPVFFYKIDLASKAFVKLVSDEQIGTLQKLLEGR